MGITLKNSNSEAIDFLYKHSFLTRTASWEIVDKLKDNGFMITRQDNMKDLVLQSETKIANLHKVCSYYQDKIGEEWRGRLAAEAKVYKMTEALRRIREAWPTVRDAEGSGSTIATAIDKIDTALMKLMEIESE